MSRRESNPFDIFHQMEMEIQRFTDEAFRSVLFRPGTDMYETPDALVLKFELPGIKPDRINVTLAADDSAITISGARTEPVEERRERIRCYQLEIYYGEFERTVALPAGVRFDRDSISANYRDGFLVITLPKREKSTQESRTIEINSK